jgi:hypothetical protein
MEDLGLTWFLDLQGRLRTIRFWYKITSTTPKLVSALNGVKIIDVSAGGYHTTAVSGIGYVRRHI